MAIRNLEAIQRHGAMIAEEKENMRQLRSEFFWKRINSIKETRQDAIDAVETILALYKNGLGERFTEWLKEQPFNFGYSRHSFSIQCKVDDPRKEDAEIIYLPEVGIIQCAWNGYGMCSCTRMDNADDYFIEHYLNSHGYDDGLTAFTGAFRPFLNAFFGWIDTI